MPSKILFIPPHPWYMQAQFEYLIRHLSDEFIMEVAQVPYPPYDNLYERYPETSPFMRNPDDYDLLVPIWAKAWGVIDAEKYKHKTAVIWYEPEESRRDVAIIGTTTKLADESITNEPSMKLRFGVDTNLFKPLKMVREDNLLHVGMVGQLAAERRMTKKVIEALEGMEGVRLMLFWGHDTTHTQDMDYMGGKAAFEKIITGDKPMVGLPNLYNQLDVLIRIDQDPGYAFPVMEAAACGVPVITTDQGVDHYITEAGGGILLKPEEDIWACTRDWVIARSDEVQAKLREAVQYCLDHPTMRNLAAKRAYAEIQQNWTWEKQLPAWREFFRKGVANAHAAAKLG